MNRSTLLCALTLLVACREPAAEPQTSATQTASASAPVFERAAGAPAESDAPAKAKSAEVEEVDTDTPPAEEADATDPEAGDAEEGGDGAEPEADAAAAPAVANGPVPAVDVRNVGMHIGGEKNTAAQKHPIRAVVQGHYDAMKQCWGKASDAPRKVTFGIDMRIPGKGGVVKVQKPRSGLEGEARKCLVDVFSAIEFPAQPGGRDRMVSFSIEFTKP